MILKILLFIYGPLFFFLPTYVLEFLELTKSSSRRRIGNRENNFQQKEKKKLFSFFAVFAFFWQLDLVINQIFLNNAHHSKLLHSDNDGFG